MAVTFKRRLKLFRLGIIILLLVTVLNAKDIGRFFYPFPYRETVNKYASLHDIDPLFLAAIIKNESNFNPRARSKKGARGLMQIMPETGEWIAEQMKFEDFHPDRLYEVETNVRLGAWYVANLRREFKGDTLFVLAAYNGGRGNVKEWLAESGWDKKELTLAEIPFPETRNFVIKVMRTYQIYKFLYAGQPEAGEIFRWFFRVEFPPL